MAFISSRGLFPTKYAQKAKKFQLRKKRSELRQMKSARGEIVQCYREREIGPHGGKGPAQKRAFAAVGQEPPQAGGSAQFERLYFIESLEKILQRVKSLNQRHRGFRADAA